METGTGWIHKSLEGSRGKTNSPGGESTNREFEQGTTSYQNRMNITLAGTVRGAEVIWLSRKPRDKTVKLTVKC